MNRAQIVAGLMDERFGPDVAERLFEERYTPTPQRDPDAVLPRTLTQIGMDFESRRRLLAAIDAWESRVPRLPAWWNR